MTEIYVDGSFIQHRVGYGYVILDDGNKLHESCGGVQDPIGQQIRQVAGELVGTGHAVRWCMERKIPEVRIYFDYLGIRNWVTGEWKAKQPFTQRYAQFMRGSGLRFHWNKVKSHTGDYWNEYVDQLAKKGAVESAPASRPPNSQQEVSTQKDATPASAARLQELERRARQFERFLVNQQVEARFDKILNGQFARIYVGNASPKALFDLYHTTKKPFSPRLHQFSDPAMEKRVAQYWQRFRTSQGF